MEYKQLSFFDLEGIKPEPEVLLNVSQHIYKVVRGDVDELIYTGETWLCDEGKERGYRLKHLKGCYDCTWNREIGSIVFYNREDACTVAKKISAIPRCYFDFRYLSYKDCSLPMWLFDSFLFRTSRWFYIHEGVSDFRTLDITKEREKIC